MKAIVIAPGTVPLSAWRDIYRGAAVSLDPAAYEVIDKSARAVSAILARHQPVYGINTGFGKLASVRIEEADLQTLQRNIVLSHAAGVGAPMPGAVVRLMMALKLGSLSQGASGVQPATVRLLETLLAEGLTPVVPCQGSVGASGDLAPLAHIERGNDRCRFVHRRRRGRAGGQGAGRSRAEAAGAGREGRARPVERHAVLDRPCIGGPVRGGEPARRGAGHRRALDRCRAWFGRALRSAHPSSASPPRPDRSGGVAAPPDGRLGDPCLASVGDERVQDPYCLRCQPQVMGAVLDILRQAATTLETEANGVTGQSADLHRSRRGSVRRQLPRRAGRLRCRHHRDGAVRDRFAVGAPHRHAGRSGAVGHCRPS